jgi:hypothetical protein
MTPRAALTWGYVKTWARQNMVPPASAVTDDRNSPVTALDYDRAGNRLILETGSAVPRLPFSWAALLEAAREVPDETRLSGRKAGPLKDAFPFLDLGHWEENPGEDYLILQYRWG